MSTTKVTTTKTCTRCQGSGSHSYNLKDGTVCYGCGGTGKVSCAPKGQKKVKPTVDHINKAKAGDIVELRSVLYRVEEVRWIEYISPKHWLNGMEYNQSVKMTRLVDDKTFNTKRCKYDSVTRTAIHPTEDMIGTLYE